MLTAELTSPCFVRSIPRPGLFFAAAADLTLLILERLKIFLFRLIMTETDGQTLPFSARP
jgi:hypothetical protein